MTIDKQIATTKQRIKKSEEKISAEQENLLKMKASLNALERQRILDAANGMSTEEAVALLRKGAKE